MTNKSSFSFVLVSSRSLLLINISFWGSLSMLFICSKFNTFNFNLFEASDTINSCLVVKKVVFGSDTFLTDISDYKKALQTNPI